MDHNFERYLLLCILHIPIPHQLCSKIADIDEKEVPDYLRNYLRVAQGGDPYSPTLQNQVAFFVGLDIGSDYSQREDAEMQSTVPAP